MNMRIGFAQEGITPPVGIALGGYAGYRSNHGAHDPLCCQTVVLDLGEGEILRDRMKETLDSI